MRNVHMVVAVVGFVFAVIAAALVTSGNIDECEREGHSFNYCYQLLYGHR